MNLKISISSILVAVSAISVPINAAFAQPTGESSKPVGTPLPLGVVSLPTLVGRVINGFLGMSGVIALMIFIYAGVEMMTAQGNAQKFERGKKTMFWAGIGLVSVFASYTAVKFVMENMGV